MPTLSDREIETLKDYAERHRQAARRAPDHVETVQEDAYTKHRALMKAGTLQLTVGYTDGFFMVSDVQRIVSGRDPEPIKAAYQVGSVAAGSRRSELAIIGCCEGDDARTTLALHEARPPAPSDRWREWTELDLDVPTGRLAFTFVGGTAYVVRVPDARYRLRVLGMGAFEGQQERERFKLELWPREHDSPMRVLRTVRPATTG